MTNEELNTKLYEKLFAEQENFKWWLLTQPPEEILNHAYEYVMREDIVLAMEYHDVSDKQAKALLASPSPLAEIFHDFEKIEGDHMDTIRECIEKRADKNIEAQREALRNLPVYIFSASFAKGHDELDEYRASFRANVECKNAIEEAIASHYADNRLDGSCVKEVVERFGTPPQTAIATAMFCAFFSLDFGNLHLLPPPRVPPFPTPSTALVLWIHLTSCGKSYFNHTS